MKNIYKGMAAATLLATASLATAGTVSLPGGVTFEERTGTNADLGLGTFKSDFSFIQWWEDSSGVTNLTDMFSTAVPGGLTDYTLNGYGELNVNDATGSFQCNGCELTFTWEGLGLVLTDTEIANPAFNPTYVAYVSAFYLDPANFGLFPESPADFAISSGISQLLMVQTPTLDLTNASMSLYLDYSPDLDMGVNIGDKSNAEDGTEWLTLSFAEVNFGVVGTPGTVDGPDLAVAGLNRADSSFGLNAESGIAAVSFQNADDIRNTPILNDLVDMIGFGLSGKFDVDNNTGKYGTYSTNGAGIASGFAVTEPTSVAIFGLGLLGFAAASRRKKS